jgi:hypothetical protein
VVLIPAKVKLGDIQKQRKQETIRFFTSRGWPIFAGYGIAANVYAECTFKIGLTGDGGRAQGIAQWHSARRAPIEKHFGKLIAEASFSEQLAMIWWEMTGSTPKNSKERECGRQLSVVKSAREAGAIGSRLYERPKAEAAEAKARGDLAELWYQQDSGQAPIDLR